MVNVQAWTHLRKGAVGLLLLLAGVGETSAALAEQQANSERARPYVATDRTATVNGLTVPLYFASTDDQDSRTVVYVPPIRLRAQQPTDRSAGDTGRLFPWMRVHESNGEWILSLEAMWDVLGRATTAAAIREQIIAWDDAESYDSQPGNINPLYAAQAWFEIEDDNGTVIRSTSSDAESFLESGTRPVRFAFTSEDEAERIGMGLQRRDAALRIMFGYSFGGDLVETCTASADMVSLQDTGLFSSLFGAADGWVERRSALEAARTLVNSTDIRTRCSASRDDDKQRLIAMLEDRLNVAVSSERLDDWASLEWYRFDPNDVMSDVETLVERQEDTNTKTETREALTRARDQSGSWSANAGWGDISGRLERSFADKDETVKENLRNVMAQQGIHAQWQGTRFIPRSVDVIANEQMRSVFDRNLEIRDERVIESGASRRIDLDEHRLYVDSEVAPVSGPPVRELSRRLTQVVEELENFESTTADHIAGLSESLERLRSEFEGVSGERESLRDAAESHATHLENDRPRKRTWQDVKLNREVKLANEKREGYSADHDIEIAVTTRRMNVKSCSIHLEVDGRRIQTDRGVGAGETNVSRWCYATITATIPANSKYNIRASENTKVRYWAELREAEASAD